MKKILFGVLSALIVTAAGAATIVLLRHSQPPQASAPNAEAAMDVQTTTVINDLTHPWDIDFLPDESLLVTEREGRLLKVVDGSVADEDNIDDVLANGEGGLMGLAVDSDFASNQFIYTCYNSTRGDVRVVRWTYSNGLSQPTPIVTGIPAAESGRHSGCQVAFGPDGNLWIGTGDSADETTPQDLTSLGGKILRVTPEGEPAADNPDGPDRRIWSHGHRNVQGLALYETPKNGSYGVSVEHGGSRDDELNELLPGNFGWAPGPGYDESVPMTDLTRFPNAVSALWSSGEPTIAPSGVALLTGSQWGRFEGWAALSVLKDQKLLLLNTSNGSLSGERTLLGSEYGRLRAAQLGPDGALYLTTANGSNDAVLRVQPKDS